MMLTVSVAEWVIAPVPLVEAIKVAVYVPAGGPLFPCLLPPPHEVSTIADPTSAKMPKTPKLRSVCFRLAAKPKIIPIQGNRSA
jgi:hypothetical protein